MGGQVTCLKIKAAVICAVAFLLFSGVFIMLIIGAILLSEEDPKVRNYVNTICQVDSSYYRTYRCKTQYSSYTCYGPIWDVHFQLTDQMINATIEQDQRYRSYRAALNKAYEYEITGNYSCWYDRRDPTVAQWDKPNNLPGIIILSCSGLCVLLCIMFCCIASRNVQKGMRVEIEMQPESVYLATPFHLANPIPQREFTSIVSSQ